MARSRAKQRGTRKAGDILSLARACAQIADDKKGEDTVILDLRKLTYITDYFVITTAGNPRQISAIASAIAGAMKESGVRALGIQGKEDSGWVLLDYVDFVVHVFDAERRELYDLGLLWGDAPRVEWERD